MMMVRSSSGRCAMRAESRRLPGNGPGRWLLCGHLVLLWLVTGSLQAAEAPMPEVPLGPPASVEAAQQDLNRALPVDTWLDEAVFTEISPLSIPEIGIALPLDQTD